MTGVLTSLLVAGALVSVSACRTPPAGAATGTTAQPGHAAGATGAVQAAPEPPKPMPAQVPDVLARVNGTPVTKADFDRLIKNMEMSAGQPVPPERRDEVSRKAIDQLVTYSLLSQETRLRNVSVSDAEIDATLKQMQSQFTNEQEFQKALASRGVTLEELRSDARIDMAISKMMEAEVASQPLPTDAQVREFYDKNPDKFTQGEAIRASHIFIKADEKADAATKEKARAQIDAVLKQFKGGADFAELAKNHSQDGSAGQGGDLNFFTKGQMVPAFDQAAHALQPGQVSDVVTTQYGYHIIKVTEKRPASTVPFEQVSPRIKEFLTEQQKQEQAKSFIDGLKKKAKIEVLV